MNLDSRPAQIYARWAGVLIVISLIAGGFGEAYVPAQSVDASSSLFRLGFAAYQMEAACDVALTFVLYVLLRPVNANIALLAVLFRVVGTATFASGEISYFAGSLKTYATGSDLSMMFYGIGSGVFGYLMFRSNYFPKALGALLAIGGLGFVARSFAVVLLPTYASFGFALPMMLALILLALWLLVKGVNVVEPRSVASLAND
jgi:hypothetical protein